MAKYQDVNLSAAHTGIFAELPIVKSATTSRVVVNNPLMRGVVFAFDTGQELTEHATPRAVIVQLNSGKMSFTIEGEESTLDAGDIVYLAPGTPHALRALEPCHLTLTLVDTAYNAE